MIRITFKDVGQGDSIIIEWDSKGKNYVGIIDCNKKGNHNPVLDHIKSHKYASIQFLLMTHPHSDHFSGFGELIQYCLDNNIIIEHFLHTANNLPDYWQYAVTGAQAQSNLSSLFKLLRDTKKKMPDFTFNHIEGGAVNSEIALSKDLKLKILSPTSTELDEYVARAKEKFDEEEPGNKPHGNWLSTFIKIYGKGWYILLTSDVDKSVLVFYDTKKPEELNGRLVLAQSPHHGSSRNHNNTFWKKRNPNKSKIPIVFSVGPNKYDHPSSIAVDFFQNNGFDIYSTNQVGALLNYKYSPLAKAASSHLNPFSSIVATKRDKLNGDKIFDIDLSGSVKSV